MSKKRNQNHPWNKFKIKKGSPDKQVYERCSVCDYSPSSPDGMFYAVEFEEPLSKKQRQSRKVYIDPRDGKPVCNVCRKVAVDTVQEQKDLEEWADFLLAQEEERLLADDEILEGSEE